MDKARNLTKSIFKSSEGDRKKELTKKWSELINCLEKSKQVKSK